MIKIWHISDTHGLHEQIEQPEPVDVAVFSGDMVRYDKNTMDFIQWFGKVDAEIKIVIAGNHDFDMFHNKLTYRDFLRYGVIYLEHESIDIQLNHRLYSVFGSPWSPSYGSWAFMKKRSKLHALWAEIPDDTQLLITHAPPKNILDNTEDGHHGCASLFKHVTRRINPQIHCFGHIHSHTYEHYVNSGVYKNPNYPTTFSNGSCVEDGDMKKITSNGNILTLI